MLLIGSFLSYTMSKFNFRTSFYEKQAENVQELRADFNLVKENTL